MKRPRTLLLQETHSQPKVQEFLESIARNSLKSREVYGFALSHFQTFLHQKNVEYTLETILQPILSNQIIVYTLLDNFVAYILSNKPNISSNSIAVYVAIVRSYLGYNDVDIVPSKFKRKVRLPKNHREDEEPVDASDIRRILLSCNNRRVKAYLLFLASGGMRTIEALAVRVKDLDFTVSPTKVHIRKEYAKTRVARDVYISDEATKFLKEWIDFKFRKRDRTSYTPTMKPDDLIFTRINFTYTNGITPKGIYSNILEEFHKILKTVGMDEYKENKSRRKITLHTLRRHVKSVIATQTNSDYSEWFLGHSKSSYWTLKEPERREIYATKITKYLTFLDYSALESTGKGIESRLVEKDKEIAYLRDSGKLRDDMITSMSDQLLKLTKEVQEMKRENM